MHGKRPEEKSPDSDESLASFAALLFESVA